MWNPCPIYLIIERKEGELMEVLEGTVRDIVFQNEENAYCVLRIEDAKSLHTAVGIFPFISPGQTLRLKGEWLNHATFGKQFKCTEYEEILPNSLLGIERYLASGAISGIGPATAKKLVEKFGGSIFEILDKEPEKLLELEGIGKKKVEMISASYQKGKEVRNIMVFMQSYGVTPKQALKIYKAFGADSIRRVKENPYVLSEEIPTIGFKTADRIARNLGIMPDSPFRIQSGVKYLVNEFCSQGNTCMPKDMLVAKGIESLEVSEELIEANLVHSVMENRLVLEKVDGIDSVFTLPYLYSEASITKRILALSLQGVKEMKANVASHIAWFEKANGIAFHEKQKEAIEGAVTNGIEIITGGPGTGKTTIIKCILEIFEKEGKKVIMGAPTGRAAKRMSEATGRESKTIHRLLELGVTDEGEEEFEMEETSSLNCDVVIVDEASMIDVMLMNNLLKSISPGTRLILVGDADQLPSVGPGRVLEDLIESGAFKVVKLEYIYRQGKESYITINAHRINSGMMPFLNVKDSDFFFIESEGPEDSLEKVIDLILNRLPGFNRSWDRIRDFQVLSPMKKGDLGVLNLNEVLQNVLNSKARKTKFTEFRVGDKVMQTKNNYMIKWTRNPDPIFEGDGGQGVFNGDIGYVVRIDEEDEKVTVIFDDERYVTYESGELEELELAYAVTIHKSQGSEFKVVVIPVFMGPPLLMSRNLIYTAVTRARQLLVLVGSKRALNYMVSNTRTFERHTSLKYRIKSILDYGLSDSGGDGQIVR